MNVLAALARLAIVVSLQLIAAEEPAKNNQEKPTVETPGKLADTKASADVAPPDDNSLVIGVVVDEQDRPVAGVPVGSLVSDAPMLHAVSDAEGKFRLRWLGPVASFTIWQIKAEHVDGRLGIANWDERPLAIKLKRPRQVIVKVVDKDGNAVAGAAAAIEVGSLQSIVTSDTTDATGTWVAKVPADAVIEQVVAFKSGLGLDHFSARTEVRGTQYRPLADPVMLKLDGAQTIRVKAEVNSDQPLPGVKVFPVSLRKYEHAEAVLLSRWPAATAVTDAMGMATFDWLPTSVTGGEIAFAAAGPKGEYHPATPGARATRGKDGLTIPFARSSKISGRVKFVDGRPATDIRVVVGVGGLSSLTKADGTYELVVRGDDVYVVGIEHELWAAPYQIGVAVRTGEIAGNVDFTLTEGTVVRGQVTMGPNRQGVLKYNLYMRLDAGELPAEFQQPGAQARRLYSVLGALTDREGRFRFCMPPGTYELMGAGDLKPVTIVVTDQAEIVHNIALLRLPPVNPAELVWGQVVDQQAQPVAATVSVTPRSPVLLSMSSTRTLPDGRYRFKRMLIPLVLYARTADGTQAGMARIETDEQSREIHLVPAAHARGRLLDANGRAMPEARLRYGIYVYENDSRREAPRILPAGTASTGPSGQFELRGVVPGEVYVLEIETEKNSNRWREVTTLKAVRADVVELGDIRLLPAE